MNEQLKSLERAVLPVASVLLLKAMGVNCMVEPL